MSTPSVVIHALEVLVTTGANSALSFVLAGLWAVGAGMWIVLWKRVRRVGRPRRVLLIGALLFAAIALFELGRAINLQPEWLLASLALLAPAAAVALLRARSLVDR